MNWLNTKKKRRLSLQICHDNSKGKREVLQVFFSVKQRETWREGEYRLAVPLAPSHPPSFPLPPLAFCPPPSTSPSSGWDWSGSRLPQTGLGAPMAPVILCGFGSVTAAWLSYGTLITPPPGGLRAARRVTSRERGKNFCLYMGIIPELLSRSACTKHWQLFWTLTARLQWWMQCEHATILHSLLCYNLKKKCKNVTFVFLH